MGNSRDAAQRRKTMGPAMILALISLASLAQKPTTTVSAFYIGDWPNKVLMICGRSTDGHAIGCTLSNDVTLEDIVNDYERQLQASRAETDELRREYIARLKGDLELLKKLQKLERDIKELQANPRTKT
jgi:GTP1/Obg family GTP-binding protein